jgi:hypothetical protein
LSQKEFTRILDAPTEPRLASFLLKAPSLFGTEYGRCI